MSLKKRTCTLKIYQPEDSYDKSRNTLALYSFRFPECYMEFKISQIDSDAPNNCYVKLFGISTDTYKIFEDSRFKKFGTKQIVEISIGYDREEEIIYSGTLSRVRYNFNYGQQVMELLLNQDIEKYKIQRHSFCISRETSVYEALQTICSMYGYSLECLDKDVFKNVRLKPTTLEGSFENCLNTILNKNMYYNIDESKLTVYSTTKPSGMEYKLGFNSGLISYPTLDTGKIDDGDYYTIKHKIIPSLKLNSTILIPIDKYGLFSPIDTGVYERFVVEQFVSTFSPTQDVVDIECRRENNG